jgi:rare lipoprotein A
MSKFSQVGPALRQATGTELTVAHSSLPIGSKIRITNQDTGQEVIATVNSRIRPSHERIIETSAALAQALGIGRTPVVVKLETIDK